MPRFPLPIILWHVLGITGFNLNELFQLICYQRIYQISPTEFI